MWYTPVTRQELFKVIEQQIAPSAALVQSFQFPQFAPSPGEPIIYWKDHPGEGSPVPTGVIVASEESRDFHAWVATYISLKPFTAYCRVIESSVLPFLGRVQEASLGAFENCYLGLILGEYTQNINNDEEMKDLSPSDCEGTLAFAMARSVALGFEGSSLSWIAKQWGKAKDLIAHGLSNLNTTLILRIFGIVAGLRGLEPITDPTDKMILECALDISRLGYIPQDRWMRLTGGMVNMAGMFDIEKMPREERIQLLRGFVDSAAGSRDVRLAFAAGYLGSAIALGTFDHYRIMRQIETRMSGVLYWYGFCCGLYRKSNLQAFSGGVGRRVIRDLERNDSVYGRPYCDIGVRELEILFAGDKKPQLPVGVPGTIEVELAPCVTTTYTAWDKTAQRQGDPRELLKELDFKLQDLARLRNKLARLIGIGEQPSLLLEPKTRKR